MRWLHPQLPQVVRWDSSMGQDLTPLTELQQLLKQALKRPLLPQQQQQVRPTLATKAISCTEHAHCLDRQLPGLAVMHSNTSCQWSQYRAWLDFSTGHCSDTSNRQ